MGTDRDDRPRLVPRYEDQGYRDDLVDRRRTWLEGVARVSLDAVGRRSLPGESMRGNVENPIGTAEMPLGVAGPLRVRGTGFDDVLYVPLATTEGALVRSYERGMVALTRAGGVEARVRRDTNEVVPVFSCESPASALELADWLATGPAEVRHVAEATTRHGRLEGISPRPIGREVWTTFTYSTGDAHGMNMIVRATDAACRAVVESGRARSFLVLSGASGEKRPAGRLLAGGKGKTVLASAHLPARVLGSVLRTDATALRNLWRRTTLAQVQSGTLGVNGHLANGLTAMFVACGQDVANVVNAAVGVTSLEADDDGSLWASLELPSLVVGTVGGGTGLATAAECLALLGCRGDGKAGRLAEIVAATCLAGELSMAAAIANGEMAAAHEALGRNRPADAAPPDLDERT